MSRRGYDDYRRDRGPYDDYRRDRSGSHDEYRRSRGDDYRHRERRGERDGYRDAGRDRRGYNRYGSGGYSSFRGGGGGGYGGGYRRDPVGPFKRLRMSMNPDELPDIGMIFRGEVISLQPYGAFIKVPGCPKEGLCHISQMSVTKINHPSEVIRVGEKVYCKVVDVDHNNRKVGVSMKAVHQGSGKDLDPDNTQFKMDEENRRRGSNYSRYQRNDMDDNYESGRGREKYTSRGRDRDGYDNPQLETRDHRTSPEPYWDNDSDRKKRKKEKKRRHRDQSSDSDNEYESKSKHRVRRSPSASEDGDDYPQLDETKLRRHGRSDSDSEADAEPGPPGHYDDTKPRRYQDVPPSDSGSDDEVKQVDSDEERKPKQYRSNKGGSKSSRHKRSKVEVDSDSDDNVPKQYRHHNESKSKHKRSRVEATETDSEEENPGEYVHVKKRHYRQAAPDSD